MFCSQPEFPACNRRIQILILDAHGAELRVDVRAVESLELLLRLALAFESDIRALGLHV